MEGVGADITPMNCVQRAATLVALANYLQCCRPDTRHAMCKSLFASRQVNREPLKVSQRTITQGTLVGGTQNHAGRLACFQGFLPTRRAKAPPITGFQTGKSKFLLRSGKVVTARFGIFEEFRCHHGTDRMTAQILFSRIAAAVAIKPCRRFDRAQIQCFPKDVTWRCPPTAWVCAIISQHCLLRTNIPSRTFSVGWFREIRIVSFGIMLNQPALTATFLSTCASASFGRVTASTPFMNLVLILSVSMPSGT